MIVCGVRDEPRLFRCLDRLEAAGVRYRAFYEPDLEGQLTALATEPIYGSKRKVFQDYQLLTVRS